MKLAALVLAAGQGSRFGGRKQLAKVHGKPMVAHVLGQLKPLFGDHLYTVLGAYADDVKTHVVPHAEVFLNPHWKLGMGHSISYGVRSLQDRAEDYDGLLIALADQVAVTGDHYRALVEAFDGQGLVASYYADRPLVPALFPKRYFPALMALEGDRGAQQILRTARDIEKLPLPEAAYDIDTVADLAKFQEVPHDR